MAGSDVIVKGFPSAMSQMKIKLFLKQRIKCNVDVTRLEDGTVGLGFGDVEGLQKFLEANLTTVQFGTETYELEYPQNESGGMRNVPKPPPDRGEPPVPLPRQRSKGAAQDQAEEPPAQSHDYKKPSQPRKPNPAAGRSEIRDEELWRKKLYVIGIPPFFHPYRPFRAHFERFGRLNKCYMSADKKFAYVTYFNHNDAVKALYNGRLAGPNTFMHIAWDRNEGNQQEGPPFHGNSYDPRRPTSRGYTQDFHDYGQQNRRSSAEAYYNVPQNCPQHRGRGNSHVRLPRAMSSNELFSGRQQHSAASGQYKTYQECPESRTPTGGPRPLMSVSVGASNQRPQTEPNKQRQPQRSKAKRVPKEETYAKNTGDPLYDDVHCWADLKELPAPAGSKCILVQNIDPTAHSQTVKMHFESKKRSGGGPLKSIIRMTDGLLVTFLDENDCDSCVNTRDQKVDGLDLKIYLKKVPSYYERKFVIKNVGKDITEDVLKMFLERCTNDETSPVCCVKQNIPGVYLIDYDGDFDIAETENFLVKVSKESLQGSKLKALKLLHSDCLKVSDIPPAASDDEIKLMFESKKRTDGGPVTKVDRLKKDSAALVYFANFEDAERIYYRYRKPCIEVVVIQEAAVTIDLYHHSLSREHVGMEEREKNRNVLAEGDIQSISTGPAGSVKVIQFKPTCHEKIFFFIKDSKVHYKNLRDVFKDIARADLCNTTKDGRIVKFFPEKKEGDQKEYEKQCKKLFEEFVAEYATKSKTFDKEKLEKARSMEIHPLLEKMSNKKLNDDFIVRWQNTTVDVTGLKDVVESTLADLENAVEYKSVELSTDKEGYRVLVYCGIVEELRKKFTKVSINCDGEKHSITINGPEGDTQQIQIAALTMQTSVKGRKVTGLDECARRYLIDNASMSQSKIQDHISGSNVKAEFGFDDDEIYIKSRSKDEYTKAVEIIKSMIVVETMTTSGPKADVVRSPAWKRFDQEIKKKNHYGLFLKSDNSIVMVGLQAEVRTLRTRIDAFLEENAIKRNIVSMSYGRAKFVLERSKQFEPGNPKRKALQSCGLTPEQGGGVFLEGIQKTIDAAHSVINQILYDIVEEHHTRINPGIKNYYMKSDGKEVLETTSRVNNCIILLDTPKCAEWERFNRTTAAVVSSSAGSPVDIPRQCLVSVKHGRVTLKVWKVDIIQHRCDVIINTSNKELKLLPGGVSGVIRKLDAKNANQIQREMDQHIQANYGHLSPGDAVLTRAGNLQNCKRIVHVVGPRWNDESERSNHPNLVLKSCVGGSLQKTEEAKLHSIAIPAISCGVFGGKPEVCIPLIQDAVLDYFEQNKSSCITQIDFVEVSNDNVLNVFKQTLSKLGGATGTKPPAPPKPQPRVFPQAATSSSSSVNLVQGDISQQNVDVVVNIMAENHVQDIRRGSAIAKSLATRAGTTLVNECAQHSGMYNAGCIFTTRAGRMPCKEVFHGLIGSFGSNSEGDIKKIIQQCLQMAAQSNYRSIAFPAIGTGGFRHPPDKVARWMKSTIEKYATNNLAASIVLHPSNPSVITAFNTVFYGTTQQNPVLSSSVNYGPLTLSVTQGDITQQQTDAIVNSTNSNFDLTQGMISNQILQQGGTGILAELQNASGDIAVTSGGSLPCRHILHLVTPTDAKDLQKKIVELLRQADAMNLSSIAIPALGTGNIQMDSSHVGMLFRYAIEAFIKLHPTTQSLNTVDIVVFDATMIQDFKDTILGDISTKKGKFPKLQKFVDGVVGFFTSSSPKGAPQETLDLFFYAANRAGIQKALQSVDNETSKVMHKELIDDPILSSVTAMEKFEIEEIEKKNDVKIENRSTVYLTRLQVVGLTKNVMKACELIRKVLRELSEAKTCVQYIAWEKKENAKWIELSARAAHGIEIVYQKGGKLGRVQVNEFQYNKIVSHTYDLSALDGNSSQIRRRLKEGESDTFPQSWDDMRGASLQQVVLKQGSAEYNKVLTSLQNTGLTPTIQSIERIQNVALYKQYAAKKAEVTEKLQGTKFQVETQLFHGTTNADKIVNNGFDRSFAGQHAAAHGNGVYFATQASYSHGYARPVPANVSQYQMLLQQSTASNVRTMFLADVITGAYTQGASGMKTPPARTGLDLYDSVVDNVNSPSMYIIFKDASAYPTYLVKYT